MKISKSSISCLFAAALLVTLQGCGGGGGGGGDSASANVAIPVFDSTMFQGVWKRNDNTSTSCFSFNDFGGSYGGLNRPLEITGTTMKQTVAVYSDNTCTTYRGYIVQNFAVEWSAGSLEGKTNVGKALVTSTGFSSSSDGTAGFTLTNPPAAGKVTKLLFNVSGTLLYIGDPTATTDASGFPTKLQTTALYTR